MDRKKEAIEMLLITASWLLGADDAAANGRHNVITSACGEGIRRLESIQEYLSGGAVPEWYEEYEPDGNNAMLAAIMSDYVVEGIRAAVVLPAIGKDEDLKPVIRKEGEGTEQLLKRFKRKVNRDGIIDAFMSHKIFKSKSERRHEKHKRAMYRDKRQ